MALANFQGYPYPRISSVLILNCALQKGGLDYQATPATGATGRYVAWVPSSNAEGLQADARLLMSAGKTLPQNSGY